MYSRVIQIEWWWGMRGVGDHSTCGGVEVCVGDVCRMGDMGMGIFQCG